MGVLHYKSKGTQDAKGPLTKVLWYLPIIPRFERLFTIKKDTSNLRWHANRSKEGHLLTNVVDSH